MFPKELWPFLGQSTLFLKEGALLLGELDPFLKKKSLLPRKLYFSPRNFYYSMGNLFETSTYLSFAQGSYFLGATNFKNYLNVLWIFSSTLFVGRNFGLK
jgi:hypothetical protein